MDNVGKGSEDDQNLTPEQVQVLVLMEAADESRREAADESRR